MAGFISGTADFIFSVISIFGIFFPIVLTVDIQMAAIYTIITASLWGILWVLLYAFFYDYIPGKGVKRGLFFGLIIWIIVILRQAVVTASYGYHLWAGLWAFTNFVSIGIVYGLLIGFLYKK